MFEYLDILFGRKIQAHGEEWLSLKMLQNRCHLAIRPTDSLPCQVHLVQEDEKPKQEQAGDDNG